MGAKKIYDPHCPSPSKCDGGTGSRLYKTDAAAVHLTPDVLQRKGFDDEVWRCSYCGFVWFQNPENKAGFEATPVGHYDTGKPPAEGFTPVPDDFGIREMNTRAYWAAREAKLRKRKQ